jgi:DNA polymerase III alpha subunit
MIDRRNFLRSVLLGSGSTLLPLARGQQADSAKKEFGEVPAWCSQQQQTDAVRRIIYERDVISSLGQEDDFIAVGRIQEAAREEGIYLRLKASGCSSLLLYLAGLSDVDPLRHQLFFERFRDPKGRWSPPLVIQIDRQDQKRIGDIVAPRHIQALVERTTCFIPSVGLERAPSLVVAAIHGPKGVTEHLTRIPLDDAATFDFIRKGDLDGVAVLHLGPLRRLLPRLQPATIEDLVAIAALYSLSVECDELMNEYLDTCGEPRFPGANDPSILEALKGTRGLLLYQEQIMMLLNRLGGVDLADGYEFIKAASKRKRGVVAGYRGTFLQSARERGIDEKTAYSLFEKMVNASGYAICKASYLGKTMTMYQAAYLKAHYPSEFSRVLRELRADG